MIFCIVPFTFLLFDFFALTLPVTEPQMLLCTSRLFMSCRLQLSGVLMFLGVQGTLLWCVLHLLMGTSACFLSWVEVPLDKIFNNKKWVPSNWSQLQVELPSHSVIHTHHSLTLQPLKRLASNFFLQYHPESHVKVMRIKEMIMN